MSALVLLHRCRGEWNTVRPPQSAPLAIDHLLRFGKLQSTLDPGQPAIEIIEADLHYCEVHLERSNIALDRAYPDGELIKLRINPVKPVVKFGKPRAQKIENIGILFGHDTIIAWV